MVRICQHGKRTDDYKIILNCVTKLMKNNMNKEAGKGPNLKKSLKVVLGTNAPSLLDPF
jgi:hypothetical protein